MTFGLSVLNERSFLGLPMRFGIQFHCSALQKNCRITLSLAKELAELRNNKLVYSAGRLGHIHTSSMASKNNYEDCMQPYEYSTI
jgi:hypothetical protein